jgi:hypothetical protein
MTRQMKAAMTAMLMVGTLPLQAQTAATNSSTTTPKHAKKKVEKKAPAESAVSKELRELREKQAAQQAEIDQLIQQNASKDAALAAAQQAAQSAQSQAQAATASAQSVSATVQANTDAVQALKTNVTDLQTTNTGLATTISNNKVEVMQAIESPTTLHYKGLTITPVAFFALESVYRTRSINSDINTPFNTTPYMSADEAHVSEFNFSGRQSRLGGLFEGKAKGFKLAGYFEADFLGAGTTSNGNQSNSFVLRQRQIWGQAATESGFTLTGGQMWSLVTETGTGTDNRTEKLPNTIDPQYMVGYNWARQPAVRLQQKWSNPANKTAFTLAMSLEEAQITNYNATNAPANFFFNGPGQNGGLFNAYNGTPTNNIAPDIFVKAAVDAPHLHVEAGGVARFFRDRIYPAIASPATGVAAVAGALPYNDTKLAGGAFASVRGTSKYIDLAFQAMAGDGVGRYGSAQLADATVHPNGTLEPLRNYHGLLSIETHPTPKLDFYMYGGGEYVQRTAYATGVAASPFTGYGPNDILDTTCSTEIPSTGSATGGVVSGCNAVTRAIFEGMVGFTYRIVSSPKYGRLQYQVNYNYLTKSGWTGITAGTVAAPVSYGAPKATNNMAFMGLRYYIP